MRVVGVFVWLCAAQNPLKQLNRFNKMSRFFVNVLCVEKVFNGLIGFQHAHQGHD